MRSECMALRIMLGAPSRLITATRKPTSRLLRRRDCLEDRWSRKSVGIAAGKHAQEDQAYLPHAVIEQRAPEMYIRGHRPAALLLK